MLRSSTNMDPKRARERVNPHWKKLPTSTLTLALTQADMGSAHGETHGFEATRRSFAALP